MRSTRALRYHEHGDPEKVLALEEIELPETLSSDEVLLRCLAAPINPADLGQVRGLYGSLKSLPAVGGNEGLAEVMEAGPNASGLRPGDRVRLPASTGTWREFVVAPADGLLRVPGDLAVEHAAMAFVNPPTAWRMLRDFVRLKPGEWVAQNAATSAVGRYVIQLANLFGLRTFNVTRDRAGAEAVRAVGGDVVAVDGEHLPEVLEQTAGKVRPRLALNAVGGRSAVDLIRLLAPGGTLVTFGGMTGEPVRFPTRNLIFDDVRLRGFWVTRWLREAPSREVDAMYDELFELIREGVLCAPVAAMYSLDRYSDALVHAVSPGKGGKILFRPFD